jgi:hypothetical protein
VLLINKLTKVNPANVVDFYYCYVSEDGGEKINVKNKKALKNEKGQDRNPAPFLIQYPMKNQLYDYGIALTVALYRKNKC